MRTVRAVGFGLVLLAGGAGTALAQNAGAINFQELFQQLDANGDMIVDRGEVPESGRAAFDLLAKHGDSNKDGKIDLEEYRTMLASFREAFGTVSSRFAQIDKNGDGKISKDEFTGPGFLFERIDADDDGFITKDEAGKFQPGQGAGFGGGAAMFAQRLRGMDKNGDGKVSKDEFTGQPMVFDRLDANKDGFLTQNEIPGGPGAGGGAGRFREMDKNGDGKVSKDEFAGPALIFERLDADKDGFITIDEMRRANPVPGKAQGKGKAARGL